MPELIFIGLGLGDEKDISMKGLESARECDALFSEFYTSKLSKGSIEGLEKLVGKEVKALSREDVEQGEIILEKARKGKVGLLVAGDPMTATTHISLRLEAEKQGIKTRIIHGSSILTAAPALLGLQSYKFGRVTTLGFPQDNFLPRSPYEVIKDNLSHNLHTLVLLDIEAEEGRYMTYKDALNLLLKLEELEKSGIISEDTLVAIVGNAGTEDPIVKAGYIKDLIKHDFPEALYCLVIPSELHFMEAEALVRLAGAPQEIVNSL